MPQDQKDQKHPQYPGDRAIVTELLQAKTPTERQLADAARLIIRYRGFPGARDIQADLQTAIAQWGLDEEQLFAQTREIHAHKRIYAALNDGRDDWA